MPWNRSLPAWPDFRYDASALGSSERRFLLSSGENLRAVRHVSPTDRDHLSKRQATAIVRMFREEPAGFNGGLSAENYLKTTGTSRATATWDLQDLVKKGAFKRTGERQYMRYWLNLDIGRPSD